MVDPSSFHGLQIAAITDNTLRQCAKATAIYNAPVSDTQKLLNLMGYAIEKASRHKTVSTDQLSFERSFQDMVRQSSKFHATLYYVHQLLKTAPYIDFNRKFPLTDKATHYLTLKEMANDYVLFGVDKNSPLLTTIGQYFAHQLQQRLKADEIAPGATWRRAETAFFNQAQKTAVQ